MKRPYVSLADRVPEPHHCPSCHGQDVCGLCIDTDRVTVTCACGTQYIIPNIHDATEYAYLANDGPTQGYQTPNAREMPSVATGGISDEKARPNDAVQEDMMNLEGLVNQALSMSAYAVMLSAAMALSFVLLVEIGRANV